MDPSARFGPEVSLLVPSLAFGHGFSKISEQHGEPQPQSNLQNGAASPLWCRASRTTESIKRGANFHDEHNGILIIIRGLSFGRNQRGIFRILAVRQCLRLLGMRAMVSLNTLLKICRRASADAPESDQGSVPGRK
jgi:hypothetical protein